MKNKLLSIAIASALSTLWSGNLLADGNGMTVTQKNSAGSVVGEQNNAADNTATSGSSITVHQEASDATSSVTITQTGATDAGADVKQYQGAASSITINQSGGAANAGNKANVIQGENGTAGSNAGNTLTINTQAGSANKIVGYSAATADGTPVNNDPASFATQVGTTNAATLNQDGQTNVMGFMQNGTSNTANLTQSLGSSNSSMNVSQSGDANKTTATQGANVDGSHVNINITGTDNNLGDATYDVEQLASNSTITVNIEGDLNKAAMSQGIDADGSNMMLAQTGNSNEALMTQAGINNIMNLTQDTDSNKATLTQNGAGDSMTVMQYGGSTATLTQN